MFSRKKNPSTSLTEAAPAPETGPVLEFQNNEIYVSKTPGARPVPLLKGDHFSIRISPQAKEQIARTIARLLPDLVEHKKLELMHYTVQVLTILSKDQITRVRQIISEELKSFEQAPHDLMFSLAQDREPEVAAPVLQFSPVLTDQDLIDIIATSGMVEAVEAIARRKNLSGLVSGAIIGTRLPRALAALLDNHTATIDEDGFDVATDEVEANVDLHAVLVSRPDLPTRTVNRIAAFISEVLLETLKAHGKISPRVGKRLSEAIADRLENPSKDRERTRNAEASTLHSMGVLDVQAIEDALSGGDHHFVTQALALKAGIPIGDVKRILNSDNGKAITALCWKAELPMRMAYQIQIRIGRVAHTKLVTAKGGKDYPLSEAQMREYLDLFIG